MLRRCTALLETAVRGAVRFPRAVKALLQRALAVRDARDAGGTTREHAAAEAFPLTRELARLVRWPKRHAANERLARHLWRHLPEWLLFLEDEGVDATNWRAEQAIRPSVVNRKVWGGNRTPWGARAQSILTSVILTCRQRVADVLEFFEATLRSPQPIPLPAMGR